jgi:hypothetical protein
MDKSTVTPTLAADEMEPWQCINKPRHLRLLDYLVEHGSITRQHADEVAPAANSPQEFADLRDVGFELPCERVPHVTMDGKHSWYGRYHLTTADRLKATEVLRLNGRVTP